MTKYNDYGIPMPDETKAQSKIIVGASIVVICALVGAILLAREVGFIIAALIVMAIDSIYHRASWVCEKVIRRFWQ